MNEKYFYFQDLSVPDSIANWLSENMALSSFTRVDDMNFPCLTHIFTIGNEKSEEMRSLFPDLFIVDVGEIFYRAILDKV